MPFTFRPSQFTMMPRH